MVSCFSDVVISFVKKTVAGVAGLLRLRNPRKTSVKPEHYEDTQVCAPTTFIIWAFEVQNREISQINADAKLLSRRLVSLNSSSAEEWHMHPGLAVNSSK